MSAAEALSSIQRCCDHIEVSMTSRPANRSASDDAVRMAEFAESRWLPHLENLATTGRLRPSTVAHYRNQVRWHVLPHLGDVAMSDLSVDRLGKLYAELTVSGNLKSRGNGPSGLSKASVRHVHITTHRMLRDAVRWGVLPTNVADLAAMDVPKQTHQTKADYMDT